MIPDYQGLQNFWYQQIHRLSSHQREAGAPIPIDPDAPVAPARHAAGKRKPSMDQQEAQAYHRSRYRRS